MGSKITNFYEIFFPKHESYIGGILLLLRLAMPGKVSAWRRSSSLEHKSGVDILTS